MTQLIFYFLNDIFTYFVQCHMQPEIKAQCTCRMDNFLNMMYDILLLCMIEEDQSPGNPATRY